MSFPERLAASMKRYRHILDRLAGDDLDGRTKSERHMHHWEHCDCLGYSAVCCDPKCCDEYGSGA